MELITQILSFFGNYTPIISFFGAIIGGEEILIPLSILSSHGFLNPYYLFVFFYLGTLVADSLWFAMGKTKLFDWLIQRKFISKVYFYWDKLLNTTIQSDFQALFITKFLLWIAFTDNNVSCQKANKNKIFFGI